MAQTRKNLVRRSRMQTRKVKVGGYKKRTGFKTVTSLGKSLAPFAQRYITKLKYCDNLSMPSAVLGLNTYRFNLNSIFDPNRTGTGHQPYGRDQLGALYNRYRVISCSYTIQVIANATVNLIAIPANEEISFGASYQAKEHPRAKWISQNPGGSMKMLKGKVYLPSLVGRTKAQYMADDRYQAIQSLSPDELAILNVYTQMLNDGTTDQLPQITVTLAYTVEFFDLIPQSTS